MFVLTFVSDNNVLFAVVAAFSQMAKEPGDRNTVAVILILCDLIFDEFNQDIIFQITPNPQTRVRPVQPGRAG